MLACRPSIDAEKRQEREKARGRNAALNRTHTRGGVSWQVSAGIGAAPPRFMAGGKTGLALSGGVDGGLHMTGRHS